MTVLPTARPGISGACARLFSNEGMLVPCPARRRPMPLAVDETVILLRPLLPLVGASIVMDRERQQNDSLVNGYMPPSRSLSCHGLSCQCRAALACGCS